MHGLQDRMEEINRTLVSYSREVADTADHKVYVAADITTSGKMMAPAGEMTYEAAFEMYQEQIGILKDSGVDLIVAETMINIEETLAAVDAASTVCELPLLVRISWFLLSAILRKMSPSRSLPSRMPACRSLMIMETPFIP